MPRLPVADLMYRYALVLCPGPCSRERGRGGLFEQQERVPIRGRPAVRGKRTYGGRPGQRVEEQGTWASHTQKHSEAGYGRPVGRGAWTAKPVKRPRQQPAQPQYANYWALLTRKRHIPPHSAQPQHTKYWAPRTRKRHRQEHRPQRPTERSDPTQHAKGRTGDCPRPRKGATTRRNVTRGGGGGGQGGGAGADRGRWKDQGPPRRPQGVPHFDRAQGRALRRLGGRLRRAVRPKRSGPLRPEHRNEGVRRGGLSGQPPPTPHTRLPPPPPRTPGPWGRGCTGALPLAMQWALPAFLHCNGTIGGHSPAARCPNRPMA